MQVSWRLQTSGAVSSVVSAAVGQTHVPRVTKLLVKFAWHGPGEVLSSLVLSLLVNHWSALTKSYTCAITLWFLFNFPYTFPFQHMLQTLKSFFCSFPDVDVRHMAVNWLRSLGSDELVDYLPQLVQALKHETWEPSPLAYFLLERALTSPRVAHHLYWLLAQALPGECPQVQSIVYAFLNTVRGRMKK
jgi:hypothetical protein